MLDVKIKNIISEVKRGLFESPLRTTARGLRRTGRSLNFGEAEDNRSIRTQESNENEELQQEGERVNSNGEDPRSSSSQSESSNSNYQPSHSSESNDSDDSLSSSKSSCGSDWSSMSDEKRKTLYWYGARATFEDFWEDFEIRAVKKKFEEHLTLKQYENLPSQGEDADLRLLTKEDRKAAKRELMRHRYTVCELRQAVGKTTIGTIIESSRVPTEWPHGRMWKIVEELLRRYRGDSLLDIIQLQKDIQLIRMTGKEHPDRLFERMWAVKKRYCHMAEIFPDNVQLTCHVVNGAAELCKPAFTNRMHAWKRDGKDFDAMFLEDLRDSC